MQGPGGRVVQIRGRAAPVAGGMHQCQGCAATLTSTGGRRYPAGSVVNVQGSLGEIGETQLLGPRFGGVFVPHGSCL